MSESGYVIELSSDETGSDNEIEVLEFKRETQDLIDNPPQEVQNSKRIADVHCPICFDSVENATVTSCGHIFCLECIQQSIASSFARGQVKGKHGVGLCPLCRKRISFKDTNVLRMKLTSKLDRPQLPPADRKVDDSIDIKIWNQEHS